MPVLASEDKALTSRICMMRHIVAVVRIAVTVETNCIHQSDDAVVDLDSSKLWPISIDQTRSAKLVVTTTAAQQPRLC